MLQGADPRRPGDGGRPRPPVVVARLRRPRPAARAPPHPAPNGTRPTTRTDPTARAGSVLPVDSPARWAEGGYLLGWGVTRR